MTAIDNLVKAFSRLPGLGKKSAVRLVLHLLLNRDTILSFLVELLIQAQRSVSVCTICGNLDTSNPCHICLDSSRLRDTLCVTEGVEDLWAIERSGVYQGQYYVLGGVLSAVKGVRAEDLSLDALQARVRENNVQEVILALNSTLDSRITLHYLLSVLSSENVNVSVLSQGVPVGGEVSALDDGTLGLAFSERRPCQKL